MEAFKERLYHPFFGNFALLFLLFYWDKVLLVFSKEPVGFVIKSIKEDIHWYNIVSIIILTIAYPFITRNLRDFINWVERVADELSYKKTHKSKLHYETLSKNRINLSNEVRGLSQNYRILIDAKNKYIEIVNRNRINDSSLSAASKNLDSSVSVLGSTVDMLYNLS